MAERTKPPPAVRVHPDRQAAAEGLNTLATILHGAAPKKNVVSYYTPELIQCTLPHSDPKTRDWIRTSGVHSLIVSSGIDRTGKPYGIPYGSFPRLVLAYMVSRVVKTGERRIDFKSYFRTFLKEIGYVTNPNARQATMLHQSLERLLFATITYERTEAMGDVMQQARKQFSVAPTSMLFWNTKQPDQGVLWDSYIEVSEEFRQSVLAAPVPLRTDMLAALKKSPLALDLYMWLSYRLYTLQQNKQDSLTLSYGSLQAQFGTSISSDNYRSFRREFRQAFQKVKSQWETLSAADGKPSTLHCQLNETTLTLHQGPLLLDRMKDVTPDKAAQAILTSRKFDAATLRKARQLAGIWDVNVLQERYFDWLQQKQITPTNLPGHFFEFIRTHCQRNG